MSLTFKRLSVIAFLAVILGASIPIAINIVFFEQELNTKINTPSLPRFASYEELTKFINQTSSYPYYLEDARSFTPAPGSKAQILAEQGGLEYSQTNIQVAGVDEADTVKSDGQYIYLATSQTVVIARAYPPEEARHVASIAFNETEIVTGLFINGDRLVVFLSIYGALPEAKIAPYPVVEKTTIKIYDVANRATPRLVRDFTVDGAYFDSRMISNYVYVLTSQPVYILEGNVTLPRLESNGMVEKIEASHIYYSNTTDWGYAFTTISAINVLNDKEAPSHETFLFGFSGEMYVSLTNIYLAIPGYANETQNTTIHRIRIEKGQITVEASGKVPGYVLNQFSMDEFNGYFRIATTTGHIARFFEQTDSKNHVYVLNMDLNLTGKIENLAPGEQIYSARFLGTRCYLVTFKKIDPLFVISLEDPSNPTVLGELKIPGYSDYLHPYDANHLIGIGKNTVEAQEGDFAWYQGVKISLFDVSNVEEPREIANFTIGDRGTDSPVLHDHKALLFAKDRHLLAIPALVAEIDESMYPKGVPPDAYGEYVWQGLYVFNITEDEIALKGQITHMENNGAPLKERFYYSSEFIVERSLYIEDVLYAISAKKISMNTLTNLAVIGEIEIP